MEVMIARAARSLGPRNSPKVMQHTLLVLVTILIGFTSRIGSSSSISSDMMTVPMFWDEDCAGCAAADDVLIDSDITPEKLRQIKLEIIKQQILQKLRLKKPPNVTNQILPELLVSGEVLQSNEDDETYDRFNKDDFYGTTQQVVVFPEKTNAQNCYSIGNSRRSSCFRFKLTHEVTSRGVSSAEIWMYVVNDNDDASSLAVEGSGSTNPTRTNVTFTIVDVVPLQHSDGFRKAVIAIKKVESSSSWIKFQLTSTVRSWSQRKQSTHLLEIVSDDAGPESSSPWISTAENQKPFVVIHTDTSKNDVRRRRSITCTDDSTHCCKEKFMVNFSEINWHRWIIFPYAYEANFCRGSCLADISSSRYHYTTILRRYIHQKSAPANNNVTVTLCCTPYIMRPLTLLYIDEENNLFKTALPNMIVESCECA